MSDVADVLKVVLPAVVTGAFTSVPSFLAGRRDAKTEVARIRAEGDNAREAREHEDFRARGERERSEAASRSAKIAEYLTTLTKLRQLTAYDDPEELQQKFEDNRAALALLNDPSIDEAAFQLWATPTDDGQEYRERYHALAALAVAEPS